MGDASPLAMDDVCLSDIALQDCQIVREIPKAHNTKVTGRPATGTR